MGLYWVPEYKWQLVDWLKKYDPSVSWDSKKKKQLMAIYINLRKKGVLLKHETNLCPSVFDPTLSSYFNSREETVHHKG